MGVSWAKALIQSIFENLWGIGFQLPQAIGGKSTPRMQPSLSISLLCASAPLRESSHPGSGSDLGDTGRGMSRWTVEGLGVSC